MLTYCLQDADLLSGFTKKQKDPIHSQKRWFAVPTTSYVLTDVKLPFSHKLFLHNTYKNILAFPFELAVPLENVT